MVIYDFICGSGHEFEGWFKNPDELASQQASGLLTCPYCDTSEITKKISGLNLSTKSNASSKAGNREGQELVANTQSSPAQNVAIDAGASPEAYNKLQKMLGEVHSFIDSNFEDVGNRFADEALSIHRGEKEAANIRGTANREQLTELASEGVVALPMPAKPADKKKLN